MFWAACDSANNHSCPMQIMTEFWEKLSHAYKGNADLRKHFVEC